jgi:hypothetical protein
MKFSLIFPVHAIPLWFIVLSLFLPRLCMVVAWFQHSMPHFIPSTVGIVPVIVAMLIPRIFILFWIYQDQGITIWFLLHLIALLCAWGGGSRTVHRRRRVEVIE